MQQREVGANYQNWVSKLMAFDFEILYKVGTSNRVADALSRKTAGEVVLSSLITTSAIDWTSMCENVAFASKTNTQTCCQQAFCSLYQSLARSGTTLLWIFFRVCRNLSYLTQFWW